MASNNQTLKGFRDIMPTEAFERQWLKDLMIYVFEKWAYEPIETPTLEPIEIFEGQVGEDEKLFYKFKDYGDRDVALRYDQTVPTARFLGNNFNNLTFPFRRYQIGNVFRAEKPQKGRFREFTQVDGDIFGVESPTADAEVIAIAIDILKEIGFEKFKIKISSRSLLKEFPYEAIVAIDKLEKIGKEGVVIDMISKGISESEAKKYLEKINNLTPNEELKTIFNYLKSSGYDEENYIFEPTLARSFSYSQGPIWEMVVDGYEAGSVGGGERYDSLVKKISGQNMPGTGFAFGFERLLEAAKEANLVPDFSKSDSILVTVFNDETYPDSLKLAQSIRNAEMSAFVYPDLHTKLGKQLKYADQKNIPTAIILGPDEIENNQVVVKDLVNRTEEKVDQSNLINYLQELT